MNCTIEDMTNERGPRFTERWFNVSPNTFGIAVGAIVLTGAAYLDWCAEGPSQSVARNDTPQEEIDFVSIGTEIIGHFQQGPS